MEQVSIVRKISVVFRSAKEGQLTSFAERKATIKNRSMLSGKGFLATTNFLVAICRLVVVSTLIITTQAFAKDVDARSGDWTVSGVETIRDQHIQLDGKLILPKGTKLTLENCTLEITGEYSRQHSVEWDGGTLVTRNCKIGGFVNEEGTAIHTVFHLFDGLWEAVDTTVSYSYGISFHWAKGQGVLRGTRFRAGVRPDAIILSGEADVSLVDSDFPIGLGVYCDEGGKTTLDLVPSDSITATYDRENLLPGVNWRLDMTNTRVERWFLFLRNIGDWQPPAEVTLASSRDVIVALFQHNLKGEVTLTNDLAHPLVVGNLTLKRGNDEPAGVSMYAMYFSGEETNATIRGRTHVCEWMQGGGTVRVEGIEKPQDLTFGCTTLELSNSAKLIANRVHFGRPMTWQAENSMGEANLKGDASLEATDISVNKVRFRADDNAKVKITGVERLGELMVSEEGGKIEIQEGVSPKEPSVSSRPKVTPNNPLSVDGEPFYGADPSVVVADDGRLFLFPTTDNRDWEKQFGWSCYSSTDLVQWTNHGVIFSNEDSKWGSHKAWAPDIIQRDGTYYFFYYFNNGGGGTGGIGVAVADKPEGPFQEITPQRLCPGHDPAVFGDEDGRCWMYVQDKVYELDDDMVSFRSGPTNLNLEYRPEKFEAAYVFKRNGLYYFTIARDWNNLIYYTGSSPTGPFEFRGEFFKEYGGNNHHSIVKYKDEWVIFYHEWVKDDPVHQRRLRAEYLHFNEDGTIQLVEPTDEGVHFAQPDRLSTLGEN